MNETCTRPGACANHPDKPETDGYAAGFRMGLGMSPAASVRTRVQANRDRARVGSTRWHYNVGILTALDLPQRDRSRLLTEVTK